eukprot:1155839-Pleurochrysis_carterae.AAC.2
MACGRCRVGAAAHRPIVTILDRAKVVVARRAVDQEHRKIDRAKRQPVTGNKAARATASRDSTFETRLFLSPAFQPCLYAPCCAPVPPQPISVCLHADAVARLRANSCACARVNSSGVPACMRARVLTSAHAYDAYRDLID